MRRGYGDDELTVLEGMAFCFCGTAFLMFAITAFFDPTALWPAVTSGALSVPGAVVWLVKDRSGRGRMFLDTLRALVRG